MNKVYMVTSESSDVAELYNHGVYTEREDAIKRMIEVAAEMEEAGTEADVSICPLVLNQALSVCLI